MLSLLNPTASHITGAPNNISDKHNSNIFEAAVTKAIGLQLFLSLVSPVLFLIIGTIAVFMKMPGK